MHLKSVICTFALLLFWLIGVSTENAPLTHLSQYQFFTGKISDLNPANGVFAYEINAPLFTDYAEKKRFIYLPTGTSMQYDSVRSFQFPKGAVIIKNFYYFKNAAFPEQGKRIVETRLLIKEERSWKALTYIWDNAQEDALLEVAGAEIPVEWLDADQKKRAFSYAVPNQNQCKGCHSYDGQFTPIGPNARQLNRNEQLEQWAVKGYLTGLPAGHHAAFPDYRRSETSKNDAARSYLEGNCSHCHNPHGPASTSGLFLNFDEQSPERIGIGKPPVAAGRGSGNRKFGIVPGKPDQSILLYRMENNDPGIRMPEVGKQLIHEEGVQIIRKWIQNMEE